MKKDERFLLSINGIDDEYIDQAKESFKAPKKRIGFKKILLIAACITVLLSLYLFVPYSTNTAKSVSDNTDSEYYFIIEKLNNMYYGPKVKSQTNFQYLARIFFRSFLRPTDGNSNSGESSGIKGPNLTTSYIEATDNQVQGIIESDVVKRSDKHIYYLQSGEVLKIYSIDKENSALVGEYSLQRSFINLEAKEMFLSQDCKTVTVIAQTHDKNTYSYETILINLDVSDPANISIISKASVSGSFTSSRMVNGKLLLITDYLPMGANYNDDSTFIPYITDTVGRQLFEPENIYVPETVGYIAYKVISYFDVNDLRCIDNYALFSCDKKPYINENYLFFSCNVYRKESDFWGRITTTAYSEICAVSYGEQGLSLVGSVTVEGIVDSRFSMDEYGGYLRVATSTETLTTKISGERDRDKTKRSASLYCIGLSDWKVVSSVEKFAPNGDEITSARFDGNYGYICTALKIEFTDPVYFFDLTDINNITYTDTGIIEGFSSSLISFGDGYLLGIGYGDTSRNMKIEIYKDTEQKVVSVCKFETPSYDFPDEYKSYLIDRENKLFGVCFMSAQPTDDGERDLFVLLQFKNEQLTPVFTGPLRSASNYSRALYIDGYLYMLGDGEDSIKVEKVELN